MTCDLELTAWKDFLPPPGPALVTVDFNPESAREIVEPSVVQRATLRHLVGIQADLRAVVEEQLRQYYDSLWPKYATFAEQHPDFFEDFARQMPRHPEPGAFARLHTLLGVFIHPVVRDDLAYVGFSFGASWEVEHGVGVLTHDRRVVEVGGADVSFLQWIAEQDRDDKRP